MYLLKKGTVLHFGAITLAFVLASGPSSIVKCLAATGAPLDQADGRGLSVKSAKTVETLPTGSKRFALVIGVDEYSPNTFQTFLYRNGETKLLKVFRVPEKLNVPGDKYHIIIEAQGQEIKHYLQVKSNPNSTRPQPFSLVSDASFSNGRIGFGTREGEEFIVQFVSIIPTK
ncbi:MAG TPA: hypothetical protein VKN18_19730 [Blastocatellia bacterium]|nr:hypothetical protein [Blastocatellia bacterium]